MTAIIISIILTVLFIFVSAIVITRLHQLNEKIELVYLIILSQNEYFIRYAQYYKDCHYYNLLTLKIYIADTMNSAIVAEKYELANHCRSMLIEINKLINSSTTYNK
jgi:hypothetical protein